VEPPPYDKADRIDTLLVLGVMLIDIVLLAIVEMMFVTLRIGGVPVPISSILALISTPWLVRRTADLPTGTLGGVSVFLAWVGTTVVLGFTGPGGDVLLPEGWTSQLLLAAGALPGALALGRAIRARRDAYPA
jgi:hypothetical protein